MLITMAAGDSARADQALVREITQLAAPNYEDSSAILERELAHCTHLYLARHDHKLVSFFMVAYEHLSLDGAAPAPRPALYLGLSAAQHTAGGAAAVMRLYGQVIADAMRREHENGDKLLIWSTTASPMIYTVMQRYLADVEPRSDGAYSSRGETVARSIARWLHANAGAHPFVLSAYASKTRYAPAERARIDLTLRAQRFDLFRNLSIDESAGDRLLIIAATPDDLPGYFKDRYAPVLSGNVR